MILSDRKIFGIVDTAVVRYNKEDRFQLIEAVVGYLNELLSLE